MVTVDDTAIATVLSHAADVLYCELCSTMWPQVSGVDSLRSFSISDNCCCRLSTDCLPFDCFTCTEISVLTPLASRNIRDWCLSLAERLCARLRKRQTNESKSMFGQMRLYSLEGHFTGTFTWVHFYQTKWWWCHWKKCRFVAIETKNRPILAVFVQIKSLITSDVDCPVWRRLFTWHSFICNTYRIYRLIIVS